MPITDITHLVTASGGLPNGEVWYNNWCANKTDPGATVADLIAQVAAFYSDYAALDISSSWTLQHIRVKNLVTEVVTDNPVNPALAGSDAVGKILPTELAIRASLKAPPNVNGGPFLTGWTSTALDSAGRLGGTNQADLLTAITDFATNLIANDWELVIHMPTSVNTSVATQARVGEAFDVIRKRGNAVLEDYASATL